MKVKKLVLKGYKRFKHLTIDLGDEPKRIVALVGPNGCGKSSVFDGMLFLHNAYGFIGNKDSKDFKYHSLEQIPSYNNEQVDIEFTDGDYHKVMSQKQNEGKENTVFSLRSPYRYNSNLKVKESKAVSELRLNNYGASQTVDLDDKMEENYRRLYVKFNKYREVSDCKTSEAKIKIIGDLNNSIKNCLDLEITSIGSIESDEGTLYFTKSCELRVEISKK